MKTLFKYLSEYKKQAVLGPLFKLLEAVFELFVPLIVAGIIDNGIKNADRSYVTRGFAVLILLGLVGYACSITAQYFAARSAVGCSCRLRYALFEKVSRLSFSNLDKIGISTLITRCTGDLNQVQNGVNLALRLLLRSPFVVFGAMIMAFTINARTALIFLAVIAVLFVIVAAVMAFSIPAYKNVQGKLDDLTSATRENLTGTRVIRAFRMEDSEQGEFFSLSEELKKRQLFAGRISAVMNPATTVVLNIGIMALLYFSGIRVNAGEMTDGNVVALYNYMTQILVELIKFANLIITITKSISSMHRIEEVLLTDDGMVYPTAAPTEDRCAPAIEFRNVSMSYTGGDSSLENISFSAERGETIGIIGGTGSGKTTLVNLIERFYDVSEGEVLVCGVNVKDYPAEKLRSKIGYVLQRASLLRGTIKENLLFADDSADDEALTEALRVSQSTDVVASKEKGILSEIEQSGRNLSGGQRQRLTIARALVRRPEILILDDSASALDFATDAALRQETAKLEYEPTTVIISQRTSSVMHADKILVLDDGRLVGMGRHEELLEGCDVYREIYSSQFGKVGA